LSSYPISLSDSRNYNLNVSSFNIIKREYINIDEVSLVLPMDDKLAQKKPKYVYKAKLKRVIDGGDTIDLIVDAGFYISVHQRFWLKGIDTPKIFGVEIY
jgi:endonuclease YncB( thermonuclease family)